MVPLEWGSVPESFQHKSLTEKEESVHAGMLLTASTEFCNAWPPLQLPLALMSARDDIRRAIGLSPSEVDYISEKYQNRDVFGKFVDGARCDGALKGLPPERRPRVLLVRRSKTRVLKDWDELVHLVNDTGATIDVFDDTAPFSVQDVLRQFYLR